MELKYLCEFLVIAELGNFTLASDELFTSQSSLSKHIKSLEKELGLQLFDRTTRNVALTEAGKLLLPYARQAYQLNNGILNLARAHNSTQFNSVRIVTIPVMAQYEITKIIARFQRDNPSIMLTVIEREPNEIPRLLETGECELAFARKTIEGKSELEFTIYCEDHLVAVLSEDHPLAQEKQIELWQLKDERFMFLDKVTMLYDACHTLCINAGFVPNIVYTGKRPSNIIDLVSNNMGISLLMKGHVDYAKRSQIKCVDITPTISSAVYLVRMKGYRMSATATQFWNYVEGLGVREG